jgi:hypothetical protein
VEPRSISLPAPRFIYTFFTTVCLTSSPTHPYQKDERALPGDLIAINLALSPILNAASHATHPLSLLSLFGSKGKQIISSESNGLSTPNSPIFLEPKSTLPFSQQPAILKHHNKKYASGVFLQIYAFYMQMSCKLHPLEKAQGRLGGPKNRTGCGGEHISSPAGNRITVVQPEV